MKLNVYICNVCILSVWYTYSYTAPIANDSFQHIFNHSVRIHSHWNLSKKKNDPSLSNCLDMICQVIPNTVQFVACILAKDVTVCSSSLWHYVMWNDVKLTFIEGHLLRFLERSLGLASQTSDPTFKAYKSGLDTYATYWVHPKLFSF